jgi:hypothetical protein
MAQWIGIILTGLALLYAVWKQSTADAAREARYNERQDAMKADIKVLQDDSQTPEERDALTRLAHAELETHITEDFQKFKALDDRMITLATNWDRKLDMILQAVTKNGR